MANSDKQKQRSCLYDLGWIRQKGEWLSELKGFAHLTWVNMEEMERTMRAQIMDGSAYRQSNKAKKAASEAVASYIVLDTGVVGKDGSDGKIKRILIVFSRNDFGMWRGIDFEWGSIEDGQEDDDESDVQDSSAQNDIQTLYKDIYLPPEFGWEQKLSSIAVEEPWPAGNMLYYLARVYTAALASNGKKESDSREWMAFNTGLVSRANLNPIVAICKKYEEHPPCTWKLEQFLVWDKDDPQLGNRILMKKFRSVLPPCPLSLDFDALRPIPTSKVLPIDEEIFKQEFRKWLPPEIIRKIAEDDHHSSDIENLLDSLEQAYVAGNSAKDEKKYLFNRIVRALGGIDAVLEKAIASLTYAFDMAKSRLSWELTAAVPAFFENHICYLLPLSFGKDPMAVDMVLVLEREHEEATDEDKYRPRKLITLKYAHRFARCHGPLIAYWLRESIGKIIG